MLCAGFMADLLDAAYGKGYKNLEIAISRESEPLGTGGAIRNALPQVVTETVLAMNGDSYCTADLQAFHQRHLEAQSERSMLLIHCGDCRDYGRVETGSQDRITAYIEKGDAQGSGWVNAGIYLLSRQAVTSIPEGKAVSIEREIFPAWIGEGMLGVQAEGTFLDIGTPERYAQAEDYFASLAPEGARP